MNNIFVEKSENLSSDHWNYKANLKEITQKVDVPVFIYSKNQSVKNTQRIQNAVVKSHKKGFFCKELQNIEEKRLSSDKQVVDDFSVINEVTSQSSLFKLKAYAFFELMRPRHIIKNTIIFGPLFIAGTIEQFWVVFVAFCAFSLMAMSIYAFNDFCDLEKDQKHARKKSRPIASGRVTPNEALILAIVLSVLSFFMSSLISMSVLVVVGVYGGINLFYSLVGKHVPFIDLVLVASGFILRFVLGISVLALPSFLYLFSIPFGLAMITMSAGKRLAKLRGEGFEGISSTIPSFYNEYRLTWIMMISSFTSVIGITILATLFSSPILALSLESGSFLLTVSLASIVVFTQYIVQTIFYKNEPVDFFTSDKVWISCATATILFFLVERVNIYVR